MELMFVLWIKDIIWLAYTLQSYKSNIINCILIFNMTENFKVI